MKDRVQNKALNEYKVLVFDLDGTLYYQNCLRIRMAMMLCGYYAVHPNRIRELFIIKRFREIREHWDELHSDKSDTEFEEYVNKLRKLSPDEDSELDLLQYAYTARATGSKYEVVRNTIRSWMYEKPLKAVSNTKDARLLATIAAMRSRGQKVVILSDYPVADKMKALATEVDGMYSATDDRILELKPGKKGLETIMKDYCVEPEDVIMIGDRMSKDGMAAVNAGCDYIILGKNRASREKLAIYI